MTQLLLVGPRNGPLAEFQRIICTHAPDWSVLHSVNATGALARLEQRPADIVLACLPEIAQCETLFAAVAKTNPGAVRLALFETLQLTVKGAHQTLPIRGDLTDLTAVLLAAAQVAEKSARNEGLRNIIANFQDVPSPPLLYFDIREQVDNASGTASRMAEIASRDPALVARTLKIANSGFYARPRSVGDLAEAVGLVGVDTLLGLVLAAHLYTGLPPPGLRLDVLWQHSTQVAALAQQISRLEGGNRHDVSHSFLAGLLHDIGLMVLLQNEPARYQPLLRESDGDESELTRMEMDTFGITHGELGAVILTLWNLPGAVVDAVANSHSPSQGHIASVKALSVADRAVMAAEWLLDKQTPQDLDSLPAGLTGIPEPAMRRWFEARHQLVASYG